MRAKNVVPLVSAFNTIHVKVILHNNCLLVLQDAFLEHASALKENFTSKMWADLDTTLKDSLIASVEEGLRMNKCTVPYNKRLTNRVKVHM